MKIAKWGNSLAVRLPARLVAQLGLKGGDDIQLTANGDRQLNVSLDKLREERIARMRALRVPWPEGYVFNREELYDRGDREPRYWEDAKKEAAREPKDRGAAAD